MEDPRACDRAGAAATAGDRRMLEVVVWRMARGTLLLLVREAGRKATAASGSPVRLVRHAVEPREYSRVARICSLHEWNKEETI